MASRKSLFSHMGVIAFACAAFIALAVIAFSYSTNQSASIVLGHEVFGQNGENGYDVKNNTLCAPSSTYFDGSKLFIADSANNRVLIFNSIPTANNASANVVVGQPDMISGTLNNVGIGGNTLFYPRGVVVNASKLYIADDNNNRVLIFNTIATANNASANVVVGQPDMISNTADNGGA